MGRKTKAYLRSEFSRKIIQNYISNVFYILESYLRETKKIIIPKF